MTQRPPALTRAMSHAPRAIVSTVALALLAACGTMQWTKAGADQSAVSRDLDTCRGIALGRSGAPVAPAGSSEAVTDRGRPTVLQPTTGSNERFVAEHEEVSRCMMKRGYQLR